MNKDIISFKETEYIRRAGVAYHRGDLEQAKKDTRTMLVLYRLLAREAIVDRASLPQAGLEESGAGRDRVSPGGAAGDHHR